jgi:signal transduction histidine kinase
MESPSFNIVSDPRRVRQILLNLLSNAIKFGEGKPIRVICLQLDNKGVEIQVTDEGVGIAQEDISRIFEEFVQVSESKQPGTGLGLPISRRLAQLLDGSLEVNSVPGKGSTFRLILPPSLEDDMAPTAELSAASAA